MDLKSLSKRVAALEKRCSRLEHLLREERVRRRALAYSVGRYGPEVGTPSFTDMMVTAEQRLGLTHDGSPSDQKRRTIVLDYIEGTAGLTTDLGTLDALVSWCGR